MKRPLGWEDVAEAVARVNPEFDDLRKARLERRIVMARRVKPAPSPRRWVPVFGAVALAAACLVGFLARDLQLRTESAAAARFVVGQGDATVGGILSPGSALATGHAEGAALQVGDVAVELEERTVLELRSGTRDAVEMELRLGEGRFAFHPRQPGEQHLAVSTPHARIEVVGTEFTVLVDATHTEVAVREGRVRVLSSRGEEFVAEGEQVTVGRGTQVAAATHRAPERSTPELPAATTDDVSAAHPTLVLPATRADEPARFVVSSTGSSRAAVAPVRATAPLAPLAHVAPAAAPPEPPAPEPPAVQAEIPPPPAASSAAQALAAPTAPDLDDPRPVARRRMPLTFEQERRVWARIDDLRSTGQHEAALPLIMEIELNGSPAQQAEALFVHARTLDVALHRTREALRVYEAYLARYPGRVHSSEVAERIRTLRARQ